ncbi:bZIP transcription factor 27-like [Macadamia integrifolia]|uniref:bZIP transcription factor 27-like n=1 Tax=Macadamia integrifolia TaxID=60698 RepID=UPI001C4EDC9A|nr:bZIP transcription factor 27-like [Macadamia integrifolia]
MWSSSDSEQHFISTTTTTSNNHRRVSSSSSNSSSMSSPSAPLATPRRKTMEEVWKDINLASLCDHTSSRENLLLSPNNVRTATTTVTAAATTSSFGGRIFQDFLGRPFSKDPPSSLVSADPIQPREARPFTSPSSLPPPTTALSLRSAPDFHFLESIDPLRPPPQLHIPVNGPSPFLMSSLTSSSSPLDAFASSPNFFPLCKKRVSDSDDGSGDRRRKRMIKNRESAARSRARKQAYTNELEIEINHLRKENARLRQEQEQQRQEQQGQSSLFGRTAQLPKKHTIYRTSTAPF